MNSASKKYQLHLLGPFEMYMPTGTRIEITSSKGAALLALLATGRDGVRSRGWLQDILWGSRAPAQAQASLRRELSMLRAKFGSDARNLMHADHQRVRLDLSRVDVDLLQLEGADGANYAQRADDELLEGLDVRGEDAFEEWMRNRRASVVERRAEIRRGSAAPRNTQVLNGEALREGIFGGNRDADAFPNSPLLAVLPFSNLTGSIEKSYLADGVADDLTELIARLRWIPVIAPSSEFLHSEEGSGFEELGALLGARYIVEGRLRGTTGQLGIAVSLKDARTRSLLWTTRRDFSEDASAGAIGAILPELVGTIAATIDDAEMTRAVTLPQSGLATSDILWRARWHHNRYTREDAEIAGRMFEDAVAQAPQSSEALVQLADFKQRQIWLERGGQDEIVELRRLAQRAIVADHRDGRAFMIAGIAELWMKQTDAAIDLLEHSVKLNPSLAYAYSQLGAAYYLSGNPEAALDAQYKALRLNMSERHVYYLLAEIAIAQLMLGNLDAALAAADQSIMRRPSYWYSHVIRIHVLVVQGDATAARSKLSILQAAKPNFRLSYLDWLPFVDAQWPTALKSSLKVAGLDAADDSTRSSIMKDKA